MKLLRELSGFEIVPGTLNVHLPRPLDRGLELALCGRCRDQPDWEAQSGQAGYFLAPVVIAGVTAASRSRPNEPGDPGYPSDQVEIFCEVHLRDALGLVDGDTVAVRVNG